MHCRAPSRLGARAKNFGHMGSECVLGLVDWGCVPGVLPLDHRGSRARCWWRSAKVWLSSAHPTRAVAGAVTQFCVLEGQLSCPPPNKKNGVVAGKVPRECAGSMAFNGGCFHHHSSRLRCSEAPVRAFWLIPTARPEGVPSRAGIFFCIASGK